MHRELCKIATITLSILLLSSCAVTSEHRDWAFMESVGGLIVAGQDKNPNWLIVRGDVSGLKEFSCKPTLVNSALAIKSIEHEASDSYIRFYVVTTLISKKYSTTEISGVDISGTRKGKYQLQYLNPDGSVVNLKEVEIYR